MKRWFTPEEVDALIPRLEELMTQLQRMKGDLLAANAALQVAKQRQPEAEEDAFFAEEAQLEFLMLEFRNLLEQVEIMGGQVKDIDYGLVDFPGFVHGQPVLLCWRKGEPRIAWWHGVDEGFIGRKPLPSTSES